MVHLFKISIALFALCLPLVLKAQAYRLIQPGRTYLFRHENTTAGRTQFDHAIRLDSSKVAGSDTLRYNYRIAEYIGPGACLYSYSDTSWLGNHFIESPGNSFTFFNRHQDSIHFHADNLGTWRMMNLAGGLEAKATYTGSTWENVNCATWDSVRNFAIQVLDSQSAAVTHPLNGRIFKVSKQSGLAQTLSFWEMPDTLTGHEALLSLEDCHPVNALELWDLQAGDSLHVYQRKLNVQESLENFWEYVVLNRSWAGVDTLVFDLSVRMVRHYDDFSNPVLITNHTLTDQWRVSIIDPGSPWNQLPYACPDVMSAQLADPDGVPAQFKSQEFGGRLVKTHYQAIWPGVYEFDTLNNCFPEPGSQGFLNVRLFGVDGLGANYYRDTFSTIFGALERYPVWYRKGGETWGTPWDFDGLMNSSTGPSESGIRIYPQPLETEAWIELAPGNEGAMLEILDIWGIKRHALELDPSGRTLLYRDDFPGGGLYLWRVLRADGQVVARGKILVRE